MTVHFVDPHTLYNDADLREIDRVLPSVQRDGECAAREGWVDYIVDEKDLRPYVGVDLEDKESFFELFYQEDERKTLGLWNAVRRFAQKTGDGDSFLSEEEIAPIHTRVYEIVWGSIYRGLKLVDGFLEFPPEITPAPFEELGASEEENRKNMNRDGFVEGRHGIDIEKLVAKAMEWRFKETGLPQITEVVRVGIRVGKAVSLSLDHLEEKNKGSVDKSGPFTQAVGLGLWTDYPFQCPPPNKFIRCDERDFILKHELFRIKETPNEVVTTIIENYYDPASQWEQSGKMVFYVPSPVSGPRTIIVVEPREGIIKQRDSEGELTRIEESQDPWEYDNFLFSHGLPFPLVHYQDQLPTLAETASFMEREGWERQEGNTYKFVIHNPAVPAETAELYFDKWEYRLVGFLSQGKTLTFGDSLWQDPESKIRYPSERGSGVLVVTDEDEKKEG